MKKILKSTMPWVIKISIVTFFLAAVFSVISNMFVEQLHWYYGVFVVLIIVGIGVLFDAVGIAATAATEEAFHAMAARKVPSAKVSIRLVKNADQFANFCNDVIGDIAGIISGAASAAVIIQLLLSIDSNSTILENGLKIFVLSLIAALTVGGKAIGKTVAIKYSFEIINSVSKVLYKIESNTNITFFNNSPKKRD